MMASLSMEGIAALTRLSTVMEMVPPVKITAAFFICLPPSVSVSFYFTKKISHPQGQLLGVK